MRCVRTILPLLLIIGLVLLYLRSFHRADTLFLPSTRATIFALASADRQLCFQAYDDPQRFIARGRWFSVDTAFAVGNYPLEALLTLHPNPVEFRPSSSCSLFVIAYTAGPATVPAIPAPTYYEVTCPHWLPISLLTVFPLLSLLKTLRTSCLVTHKLCPKCRYDLRAHAPGQTCPECGTIISSSSSP